MRINLINKYSHVDSVKPDTYEKVGNILSYPVHVLIGRSYHQTNMTKKSKYSTGHKLLALWALITTTPITITASLVGLSLKHFSASHKAHRQAHDLVRKSLGKFTLNTDDLNFKKLKDISNAAKKSKMYKAGIQQLKEVARKAAAKPENLPTAGPQHYHPELIDLLKNTPSDLMLTVIEEVALNTTYSAGFEAALRHLISDADQNGNFELIQKALKSEIILKALKSVLDQQELVVKSNKFTVEADQHSLKLDLFFKNLNSLNLPEDMAKQITLIAESIQRSNESMTGLQDTEATII